MKATDRFVCPSCEVHELELHGRDSAVCPRCGRLAWVVLNLGGPQDTPRDKRATRRPGPARLRVRTPGDAPPPGRGVPVPGMRPGSPSHLAATLGQDAPNVAAPRRPAARGRSTKGDSGAGCGRIDLPHTAALAVWIPRDLG